MAVRKASQQAISCESYVTQAANTHTVTMCDDSASGAHRHATTSAHKEGFCDMHMERQVPLSPGLTEQAAVQRESGKLRVMAVQACHGRVLLKQAGLPCKFESGAQNN